MCFSNIIQILNLTVVFVLNAPHPNLFHRAGIPHLHFPQYTRSEVLHIVNRHPPIPHVDDDPTWLWSRFIAAVFDSLGHASRDLLSFRSACEKLWPAFVQPVIDRQYGPREFSKLMVRNKTLFQSDETLVESLITTPSTLRLPHQTAHLLVAAFLASHNPPRTDIALLSKSSTATKRRKKSNLHIARRILGPQAFGLERLLAIYHALLGQEKYKGGQAELLEQLATLVSLRLVVRVGFGDSLDGKWKCILNESVMKGVSRDCDLDLQDLILR